MSAPIPEHFKCAHLFADFNSTAQNDTFTAARIPAAVQSPWNLQQSE